MRRLLVAALTAAGVYHYWGPKPLDGTVWEVSVRGTSMLSWPRKDTLIFDGGRLTVAGPLAAGRSEHRYDTQSTGDATVWSAGLTGPKGEAMSWQGVARADRVEGTVLVTEAGGRTRRLTFSGARSPSE